MKSAFNHVLSKCQQRWSKFQKIKVIQGLFPHSQTSVRLLHIYQFLTGHGTFDNYQTFFSGRTLCASVGLIRVRLDIVPILYGRYSRTFCGPRLWFKTCQSARGSQFAGGSSDYVHKITTCLVSFHGKTN